MTLVTQEEVKKIAKSLSKIERQGSVSFSIQIATFVVALLTLGAAVLTYSK